MSQDGGGDGYGGPNPRQREHTYRLTGYGLDSRPELETPERKHDLQNAIADSVISHDMIEGTYAP